MKDQYLYSVYCTTQTLGSSDMPKHEGLLRMAQITLKAWHHIALEEVVHDILRTAKVMAVTTSGVIRLPTKISRFSVPRSPFVHKKHWDQV